LSCTITCWSDKLGGCTRTRSLVKHVAQPVFIFVTPQVEHLLIIAPPSFLTPPTIVGDAEEEENAAKGDPSGVCCDIYTEKGATRAPTQPTRL
jgi:hypothetical protein